jgi:hypothetical protein
MRERRSIGLRRLAAQRISATSFTRPEQVVAWLGAVQAQDYLGALWAVGLRTAGANQSDVEQAIAARLIVRTWPMRGTLHFVAAADARWMLELLARRTATSGAASTRLRSFGIDERVLSQARRVLERALATGQPLTRPAVYATLDGAGIATEEQRGLHILWRLAQECVVCFGPREGNQQTFVLFDEWLPNAKSLPRDQALATVAERYFASHGPASLYDFAWWTGLPVTEARRAIALAGERLIEEPQGEERLWSREGDHGAASASAGPYILPAFDELLVGYKDRQAVLAAADGKRVMTGGLIRPIVVDQGRVVGTWARRITARGVVCTASPFAPLGVQTSRRLDAAFARYAQFWAPR